MHNKKDCPCEACKLMSQGMSEELALKQIKIKDQEMIKKFGWVLHAITDDPNYPFSCNFHTHGLLENYNHPDLQIICPLEPKVAYAFISVLVLRIKEGEKFEDGQEIGLDATKLFGNMMGSDLPPDAAAELPVKLVKANECDREILRVILPDQNGSLDAWSMEKPVRDQYADLVEFDDDDDDDDDDDENKEEREWISYRGEK